MTTKEVLIRAREIVRERWTIKTLEDEYGNVCALGALKEATGEKAKGRQKEWKYNQDFLDATAVLAQITPFDSASLPFYNSLSTGEIDFGAVTHYNDNHNKDCVIELFDAAIERCE